MEHSPTTALALPAHAATRLIPMLALWLMLTFVVAFLSMLSAVTLSERLAHPNPLSAYEAIWPGQSLESLEAYAQGTPEGHLDCITAAAPKISYPGLKITRLTAALDTLDTTISCSQLRDGDIFRVMTATVETGRVQQLELVSDMLSQDALFIYWGMPDAISRNKDHSLNLRWHRGSYDAVAHVTEANFVARIVTLTANR